MSQLKIGPYTYTVLKREGSKILLTWFDSQVQSNKERWFDLKKMKASGLLKMEVTRV